MAETDETGLTERQQQVLAAHREGKNPTEIGEQLGITSQGVHGHLRRLAKRGLVTLEGRRPAPAPEPRNGGARPQDALDAIRTTAHEQQRRLDARLDAIGAEIKALEDEAAQIKATLIEVEKVLA